jgi:hypothetical protein
MAAFDSTDGASLVKHGHALVSRGTKDFAQTPVQLIHRRPDQNACLVPAGQPPFSGRRPRLLAD